MIESLKKDRLSQIVILAFIVFTVWWILLNLSGVRAQFPNYLFGAVYGPSISLFGGIIGLITAKHWGGWKSVMGKAIIFLSLGLLAESFGQIVNSYYNLFLKVEVIYPSLGDVGFFGNIPLYLTGIILLAHASGIKLNLRSISSQLQTVIIPATGLAISYILFLRDYKPDWANPLGVILDFGYPLGQALYVSFAFLTYSLSRKTLGGIMRNRIMFLLAAFAIQYTADFTFLFYNAHNAYYVGGVVDYIYLLAYTLMALGLFQLRTTAIKIKAQEPAL